MPVCPVCRIEIDEKKARGTTEMGDQTYYFCSKACKKKFDESPDNFVKK
jgi:YHS domain-containing protein